MIALRQIRDYQNQLNWRSRNTLFNLWYGKLFKRTCKKSFVSKHQLCWLSRMLLKPTCPPYCCIQGSKSMCYACQTCHRYDEGQQLARQIRGERAWSCYNKLCTRGYKYITYKSSSHILHGLPCSDYSDHLIC